MTEWRAILTDKMGLQKRGVSEEGSLLLVDAIQQTSVSGIKPNVSPSAGESSV